MIWTFFIIVVLTFVLSKINLKYGLKNVTCERKISKHVVEIGEKFQISTIIENRKAFPITFFQIQEKIPITFKHTFKSNFYKTQNHILHTMTMFVMPYERVKRIYTSSSLKRGAYVIGDIILNIGDFVGFNNHRENVKKSIEIVVLPKKLKINEHLVPYGNFNGDISVKRWIIDDPLMIAGIREYTGREPQKYIHWASSLRYGKLMVKKFDFTTDNKVLILLNVESSKPFWCQIKSKQIEKCISLTRGLVEELEERKIPYGFATNSRIINSFNEENFDLAGLGSKHLNYILENLGRISYPIKNGFEDLIENVIKINRKFTTFVIITPKVFDCYIDSIERLNNNCNKLILISLKQDKLQYLSKDILKYIEREEN